MASDNEHLRHCILLHSNWKKMHLRWPKWFVQRWHTKRVKSSSRDATLVISTFATKKDLVSQKISNTRNWRKIPLKRKKNLHTLLELHSKLPRLDTNLFLLYKSFKWDNKDTELICRPNSWLSNIQLKNFYRTVLTHVFQWKLSILFLSKPPTILFTSLIARITMSFSRTSLICQNIVAVFRYHKFMDSYHQLLGKF